METVLVCIFCQMGMHGRRGALPVCAVCKVERAGRSTLLCGNDIIVDFLAVVCDENAQRVRYRLRRLGEFDHA